MAVWGMGILSNSNILNQVTYRRRRHTPRIDVTFFAHLHSEKQQVDVPVLNLSQGGIFVRANLKEEPGALVTIDLPLSADQQPLKVNGVVVHQVSLNDSSGLGIQFVGLTREQQIRLADYLIVEICRS